MKRKKIACYLVNIPLTYLSIVLFGWFSYFIIGGNPTFIFPFTTLLIIFYFLYAAISAGILQALKIYSIETYMWIFLESAIIYIIIWSLAH